MPLAGRSGRLRVFVGGPAFPPWSRRELCPAGVESAGVDGNADCLLPLLVLEASVEHLVDDHFHLLVDLDCLVVLIDDLETGLDVPINALVDESLNIRALLRQLKVVTRLQRKTKGLIVLLKEVEDLGSN